MPEPRSLIWDVGGGATGSGDKENSPRILNVLRAKDESAHSLQLALEEERRRRREERLALSAERAEMQEKSQKTEADLLRQLQGLQARSTQQSEEHVTRIASLEEQQAGTRQREASLQEKNGALAGDVRRLLKRAEADEVDILALRARLQALTEELKDAQVVVRTSEQVRTGMLRENKEVTELLAQSRDEIRELRLGEQAARDHGRAEHEKLNAQCESLSRQAQERLRAADVLEERNKGLEEALRVKGAECDRARHEGELRSRDLEDRLSKAADEASSHFKELKEQEKAAVKMREGMAALQTQIQEHKNEEQRLRNECFRLQTTVDERELAVKAGLRREAHSEDAIKVSEERLRHAVSESEARQTALCAARAQIQSLELELRGERDRSAALTAKAETRQAEERSQEAARYTEERLREEKARENERRAEDRVQEEARRAAERTSALNAEISQLQGQLAARREELCRKEADFTSLREGTVKSLQGELAATAAQRDELKAALERCRAEVVAATAPSAKAVQTSDADLVSRPSGAFAASYGAALEVQRSGSDADALRRQVVSLQAQLNQSLLSSAGGPVTRAASSKATPGNEGRAAFRIYTERHVEALQRRILLWDVWQVWASHSRAENLRARMELVTADEDFRASLKPCSLSMEGAEGRGVLHHGLSEATLATLRSLLMEFRHRTVETVAELATTLPAATSPAHPRVVLSQALGSGRHEYGRFFHAALFLYQKVRTLVPSELLETMQDPLSNFVPVPFYVLPYKVQHAIRRSPAALARGSCLGGGGGVSSAPPAPPPAPLPGTADFEAWLEARVKELENSLPLAGIDATRVPTFLARALRIRAHAALAQEGGGSAAAAVTAASATGSAADDSSLAARMASTLAAAKAAASSVSGCTAGYADSGVGALVRDRLDVLLVDAFTVFMSAWRLVPPAPPAPTRRGAAPSQRGVASTRAASGVAAARSASIPAAEPRHRLGRDQFTMLV